MTPEVTRTDDTLVVENNRRIKLVPMGEWILKENSSAVCINCHRLNKYFADYSALARPKLTRRNTLPAEYSTKLPNVFPINFTKKDLFWQLLAGSDRYLCPQMWFQFDLILFTVLFWLVYKSSGKYAVKILSMLGIICIILQYTSINYYIFCRFEYELWFPLGRLAESLPFAVLGLLLSRKNVLSKINENKMPMITLSIVLIIISGVFDLIPDPKFGFQYCGINMILYTTAVFMLSYLLPFYRIKDSFKNIIRFLAKYSFGVFCVHLGIGKFMESVIYYNLNLKTGSIIECILIYTLSLIVSWGISKIPGKYSKKLVT